MLRAPTTTSFRRNLVATMEPVAEGETLEAYFRRQLEGLRKTGLEQRLARHPETVKLTGGLDGLLAERIITAPSGEFIHQMQLVCIREGIAYTLVATHLEGAPFEAAREGFQRMLLSFS